MGPLANGAQVHSCAFTSTSAQASAIIMLLWWYYAFLFNMPGCWRRCCPLINAGSWIPTHCLFPFSIPGSSLRVTDEAECWFVFAGGWLHITCEVKCRHTELHLQELKRCKWWSNQHRNVPGEYKGMWLWIKHCNWQRRGSIPSWVCAIITRRHIQQQPGFYSFLDCSLALNNFSDLFVASVAYLG